jgi:hypothetical protein
MIDRPGLDGSLAAVPFQNSEPISKVHIVKRYIKIWAPPGLGPRRPPMVAMGQRRPCLWTRLCYKVNLAYILLPSFPVFIVRLVSCDTAMLIIDLYLA